MDKNLICSNSEACLQFIHSKFDYYKQILDDDQQACDQAIASIREQACAYNNDDENLRLLIGFDRIELADQLNYFEQEAFKTNEENKTCLFKMFQILFNLHREFAFDEVLINERQIGESFQYRPSVLPNIEKIRFSKHSAISNTTNIDKNRLIFAAIPTPKTSVPSTSFSNRADINDFQKQTNPSKSFERIISPIESNEIDLTKLVRETYSNQPSNQFKFSKLSQNLQQQQNIAKSSVKRISKQMVPCDNALLAGANKRFVLIYNMNVSNILCVYDLEKNETKEFHWDEGEIQSLGHVDSNIFYLITATKIFLYDIVRENLNKQYFLYDTLYKDLLLITDDLSYLTALKRNNQIQSSAYDDFCYYLYTNKEYNHLLIKCSLDTFQVEFNLNLTKKYPDVQDFLGFTVTNKCLITFLIHTSHTYHLLFCDELQDYNIVKKISINHSIDPTKIISTHLPNIKTSSLTGSNKSRTIKYDKQLWFVLDKKLNCIHCLIHEKYLTQINSPMSKPIESISVFEEKLSIVFNELSVEIIDLDNYFSSIFQL